MLSGLDYIIIVIYFAVILLVGFLSSRKETREAYLLADRKLGILSSVATIISTKIGAAFLIVYLAYVYLWGFVALWFFIGYAVGFIIFIFFAKKIKQAADENGYYTLSDYFFSKYGKKVAYIFTILFFIRFSFQGVVQLLGGAKVLTEISGWDYLLALLLMAGVITIYLVIGGFKSVVKTDIVQFFSLIILLVIITVFLFINFPTDLTSLQFEEAGAFNIIGFFILGIFLPFSSAELWQRVYATKNQKVLVRSLISTAIIFVVVGLVITFTGIIIKATILGIDPNLVLARGFSQLLPSGLAGLGLVVLFAAIMSSADTTVYTTASFLIQNLLNISKEKVIKAMKYALFVIMMFSIILSYFFQNIVQWELISTSMMLVLGMIIFSTWVNKKISNITIMSGLLFGILALLIILIMSGSVEPDDAPIILGAPLVGLLIGALISGLKNKVKNREILFKRKN